MTNLIPYLGHKIAKEEKICFYFTDGRCNRGDTCRDTHKFSQFCIVETENVVADIHAIIFDKLACGVKFDIKVLDVEFTKFACFRSDINSWTNYPDDILKQLTHNTTYPILYDCAANNQSYFLYPNKQVNTNTKVDRTVKMRRSIIIQCLFKTQRDFNLFTTRASRFIVDETKIPCKWGKTCRTTNCDRKHPQGYKAPVDCRNGINCTTPGCNKKFRHPKGYKAPAKSPGMKKPKHQPQQEITININGGGRNFQGGNVISINRQGGKRVGSKRLGGRNIKFIVSSSGSSSKVPVKNCFLADKCKYRDCKLRHPRNWIRGSNPKQVCIYGLQCTKKGCATKFIHPKGHVDPSTRCRNGKRCKTIGCVFNHPDGYVRPSNKCKFEMDCIKADCKFEHPPNFMCFDPMLGTRQEIPKNSPLNISIRDKFYDTCGDRSRWRIVKIEKIVSEDRTIEFESKCHQYKRKLANKTGTISTDPIWAWHGTDFDTISKIIDNGFKRDYSRRAAYGKGVYFHTRSEYSCSSTYSPEVRSTGHKHLFLCNVILGQYCKGQSHFDLPQPIGGGDSRTYDSYLCEPGYQSLQNGGKPLIMVTTDDGQARPIYLVTFKAM